MASFTDMPDDVVLEILSELGTRDISALSRTCQNLRQVTIPNLYSAIVWTSAAALERPPLHLLLRSLLDNPSLSVLIKRLGMKGNVTFKNPPCLGPFSVTLWAQGEQPKLSARDIQAIEELVDAAQLAPASLWKEHVRSGNVNVYTLLVVSLLPNLEILNSSFLCHAGNEYLASLLKQILFSDQRPAPLSALSRLRQVELVAHMDTVEGLRAAIDDKGVTSLLYLSSIQTIDASFDYQKKFKFSWPGPTPPNSATLTALRLRCCEASEDYLARILSTTPNLQILLYDRWIDIDDPNNREPRLDLAKLIRAVSQVRHTLKELSLPVEFYAYTCMAATRNDSDYYDIQNRLGSLRDFTALETLEAPWVFMFGYARRTSQPGEKLELPPSIRHLRIGDQMGDYDDYVWTEQAMLHRFEEDLLSCWRERTPALERIDLRLTKSQWDWVEEGQEKLRRMCATAGVMCDVHKELDI